MSTTPSKKLYTCVYRRQKCVMTPLRKHFLIFLLLGFSSPTAPFLYLCLSSFILLSLLPLLFLLILTLYFSILRSFPLLLLALLSSIFSQTNSPPGPSLYFSNSFLYSTSSPTTSPPFSFYFSFRSFALFLLLSY